MNIDIPLGKLGPVDSAGPCEAVPAQEDAVDARKA